MDYSIKKGINLIRSIKRLSERHRERERDNVIRELVVGVFRSDIRRSVSKSSRPYTSHNKLLIALVIYAYHHDRRRRHPHHRGEVYNNSFFFGRRSRCRGWRRPRQFVSHGRLSILASA